MPFDFAPSESRSLQGLANYHDGLAAEDAVENLYLKSGHDLCERRWRGKGGEIDLIFRNDEGFVFVEVKKSRTFDRAAEALSVRQMRRICHSAEDYCATQMPGKLINMRLDLAMVDGTGRIKILENISLM